MPRDIKIAWGVEAAISLLFSAFALKTDDDIWWWYAMIPWVVCAVMFVFLGDKK